jgi:1-acyl-sn-glycerol-3-phosphate acyltransferase
MALDLGFGSSGLDAYGVSRRHLMLFYSALEVVYRRYFRVQVHGIHHVTSRGRGLLVGNHSGGVAFDGGMVLASLLLDHDPPRHAHGMVDYFAQRWPLVSQWFARVGQFPGLPEHAVRLLEDDRLLMVFPEGTRGVGKLWSERYRLQRFGTGFVRLALKTQAPIYPFAFIGAEEAMPVIHRSELLRRLSGAPYWPVTPWGVPFPLPKQCSLHYGPPLRFEGSGNETDDVVAGYVLQVEQAVAQLIGAGRRARGEDVADQDSFDVHIGGDG